MRGLAARLRVAEIERGLGEGGDARGLGEGGVREGGFNDVAAARGLEEAGEGGEGEGGAGAVVK